MTTIKTPEGRRLWVPVFTLALAAFIFVTTEILPIGLLPEIAADLGETEAFTGLLVAVYAWVVALLSLPLTALTARFERRKLLLWLFAIFIAGHVLSAFGYADDRIDTALRLSFSPQTTKEDLDYTVEKLKEIVQNLRNMSPLYEDFIKKQNV